MNSRFALGALVGAVCGVIVGWLAAPVFRDVPSPDATPPRIAQPADLTALEKIRSVLSRLDAKLDLPRSHDLGAAPNAVHAPKPVLGPASEPTDADWTRRLQLAEARLLAMAVSRKMLELENRLRHCEGVDY